MSFIIKPLESVLEAPKLVCCINGKTPTEGDNFDGTIEELLTEETVNNGDGTYTTTWTTTGAGSDIFNTLEFKLCCTDETEVIWSSVDVSAFIGSVFTGNGITKNFSTVDPSGSNTTDLSELGGPCGISVQLQWEAFGPADTWSFSITY
jgi:hypothetical protein